MTDLIAPQVTQAIAEVIPPQGMGFTIFDWQVALGIPAWIFIDAFFIFCVAAVAVYWWAKLRKLSAVSGWAESLKNMDIHDVQVWIISRTQKLIIGCMKIEDNVLSYHDPTKIGMWHHNTRESVIRIGGNPAVVVSEDYDQTRDIISEIALTDNCDEMNKNQDALIKWKEETGDTSMTVSPIESYEDYEDYGRETLQLIHPEGLPMKAYNIFNNIRFLKYFPKGCSHMFFGGELELESRGLHQNENEKGFWEKHALLIGSILIAIVAIGAAAFVPLHG